MHTVYLKCTCRLCNAALLGQLPDKEDFSTAYLLNNLHLKLCRVRVLLADHIQTPQQLQERMSQDEPLQQRKSWCITVYAKMPWLEVTHRFCTCLVQWLK